MSHQVLYIDTKNYLDYYEYLNKTALILNMDYILLSMSKKEKPISLKDIDIPLRLEDKPLIAPGIWNGYYISPDLIKKAYETTDWSSKEVRSLFLDHNDRSAGDWVGEVDPNTIHFDPETGMIRGDLIIVDLNTALKLAYGAKFGISPSLAVVHDNHVVKDFSFRNFAIVVEPAMTTNYINNSKIKGGENMEEKIVEILENLAQEVKNLKEEFSNFKNEYDAQFEVSPDELLELAKLPSFSEFYKEYKKKYPKATMEEAAKAYKKLKAKYPYPETADNKKKKEEYPYPEDKYPKDKKKKNFEKEDEPSEESNEPEKPEEPEPETKPEEPEQKPEEKPEENSEQQEDKPEEKEPEKPEEGEQKEEKSNDVIAELKEKITVLEEKLKSFEKPVVDSPAAAQNEPKQIVKSPDELFYEFVEKLKKGG